MIFFLPGPDFSGDEDHEEILLQACVTQGGSGDEDTTVLEEASKHSFNTNILHYA